MLLDTKARINSRQAVKRIFTSDHLRVLESGRNIRLKAGTNEIDVVLGLSHSGKARQSKFLLIFLIFLLELGFLELDHVLKGVDLKFVNVALTIFAVAL